MNPDRLSPLCIEILLHCYYCNTPFPRASPAATEEIAWLKSMGLVINNPEWGVAGNIRTTPLGDEWVERICRANAPSKPPTATEIVEEYRKQESKTAMGEQAFAPASQFRRPVKDPITTETVNRALSPREMELTIGALREKVKALEAYNADMETAAKEAVDQANKAGEFLATAQAELKEKDSRIERDALREKIESIQAAYRDLLVSIGEIGGERDALKKELGEWKRIADTLRDQLATEKRERDQWKSKYADAENTFCELIDSITAQRDRIQTEANDLRVLVKKLSTIESRYMVLSQTCIGGFLGGFGLRGILDRRKLRKTLESLKSE